MPLLTLISRLSDGLILCASLEAMDKTFEAWTNQARQILSKLNRDAPPCAQLDSGDRYFLYLIKDDVCFITLCEKSYPKKLAFAFLDEIQKEYSVQFEAREVSRAKRPYEHIRFDQFIQKTKKLYSDQNSQRNLSKIAAELTDVQRILSKNVEEILGRGERMSTITQRAEKLLHESARYEKDAKKLASSIWWRTYGPFIGGGVFFVVFLFVRFFWF